MGIGEKLKAKSREITDEISQQYREHIGEELAKKAQTLKDLEASLNEREKEISQREERLSKYYLVPRIYVQLAAFIGLFIGAFFIYTLFNSAVTKSGTISAPGSEPSPPSRSMNAQKAAVYGIYGDIDAKDPDFDVGGYCLDKEKEGAVTFDQCIAIAAAKIAPK